MFQGFRRLGVSGVFRFRGFAVESFGGFEGFRVMVLGVFSFAKKIVSAPRNSYGLDPNLQSSEFPP